MGVHCNNREKLFTKTKFNYQLMLSFILCFTELGVDMLIMKSELAATTKKIDKITVICSTCT